MSADPKLSNTTKMPCKSFSLEAGETCPASRDEDGTVVDSCQICYAKIGYYRMDNTKGVRQHNKKDWKNPDWVQVMVNEIKGDKYFRWFDSGDCYHTKLAFKILEVMRLTPETKHWMPTKQYKFLKFRKIFERMNGLSNVAVRYSSDSIVGETIKGEYTSTIIPNSSWPIENVKICHAYKRKGKCGFCRICWNKAIKTVAYPAHGAVATKILKWAV